MSEDLSNLGTDRVEATKKTNVTGQMTPILEFSPIDGMEMDISNFSSGGEGVPVIAELRDSNGDLLPLDTQLTIEYDAPHLDKPETVAHTLSNIRVYRELSVKEQQSEEYRERTRVNLKGRELEVRDIDSALISIESSEEIDWDESRVYVDGDAVTVHSEGVEA